MHDSGQIHVGACARESRGTMKRELEPRRSEDRTVMRQLELMRLTGVVEAWGTGEPERHFAANPADQSNDAVVLGGDAWRRNRHEVDQLRNAALGHEARDQYGGIRKVQLLSHVRVVVRCDPKRAAAGMVHQTGKHARPIETGTAKPIDSAID